MTRKRKTDNIDYFDEDQEQNLRGTIKCPECGRSNPVDQDYCDECGTMLDVTASEDDAEDDLVRGYYDEEYGTFEEESDSDDEYDEELDEDEFEEELEEELEAEDLWEE